MRDNQALQCCKSFDALLNVYVVDARWFRMNEYQSTPMGRNRWQFVRESLDALRWQLRKLGQDINILYGDPAELLAQLIVDHGIDVLHTASSPGNYEKRNLDRLQRALPDLDVQLFDQSTLFTQQQIKSHLPELPGSFSKFEKKASDLDVTELSALPEHLPKVLSIEGASGVQPPSWYETFNKKCLKEKREGSAWKGGEVKGQEHIAHYFSSELPKSYFSTRNDLDGWDFSTKFSCYLSHGCVSPKQIHRKLSQYLGDHTLDAEQSKSVNWIYKEILWREYFQWLAHDIGSRLFKFKGLAKSSPLTSFYPERFKKWCEGTTPYALVNACMRELKETGFLSNRGRQIVASCLVNELGLDWRYGAAWFEEQLIDYDVASNWGNWQYIAGVGVDPRGGRHFNLDKQTQQYDPNGEYRNKWLGDEVPRPLDSVDMVDWPVV